MASSTQRLIARCARDRRSGEVMDFSAPCVARSLPPSIHNGVYIIKPVKAFYEATNASSHMVHTVPQDQVSWLRRASVSVTQRPVIW